MNGNNIGIKRVKSHIVHKSKERKNTSMPLNPLVKKSWVELQKKHDVPVNAIGVKIDPKDQATLKVWKEEGIDQFQKKK